MHGEMIWRVHYTRVQSGPMLKACAKYPKETRESQNETNNAQQTIVNKDLNVNCLVIFRQGKWYPGWAALPNIHMFSGSTVGTKPQTDEWWRPSSWIPSACTINSNTVACFRFLIHTHSLFVFQMTTMRSTKKDTCLITGGSGYFGYR